MTEEQLNDILEDIMTSTWDSGRTKILNFARLMCDRQKEICKDNAKTMFEIGNFKSGDAVSVYSILTSPYPEELL